VSLFFNHGRRAAAAVALGTLLLSPLALAQQGVDAQTFRPALDSYGMFSVERARTSKQFDFGFKLGFDYTSKPLRMRLTDSAGQVAEQDVIDSLMMVHLQSHMGLTDWLSFAIDLPMGRTSLGPGFGDPAKKDFFYSGRALQNTVASDASPGDVRLGLKARALTGDRFSLAGLFTATLPFGNEQTFNGANSHTYEPKIVADITAGGLSIAANAGFRIHQSRPVILDPGARASTTPGAPAAAPVLADGHEVILSVGTMYRIGPYVGAAAEYFRSQAVAVQGGHPGDSTNDILVGAQIYPATDFSVSVAGGTGFGDSVRKDSFRVVVGLAWSPEAEASGGADRDGDGVSDDKDLCPDEPEDKDAFEDEDGCPDPDNDRDGVPDKQDKCPTEAEDRDAYQDEDGCPDVDNDADGIADVQDKCPNEAEDKDGFQDEDGCPDPDNDGDGIADDKDKCPNEPETKNGIDDEDGCPDGGPVGGKLESISDQVRFPAAKAIIDSAAQRTLDRVADQLRAHPDVSVRLEGHADPTVGKPGKQEALSAARAEAVREYLVKKGISPNRMSAVGYGGKRPLVTSGPKIERAKNDRVEFIVTRSGQ
jgi:outer membrane protein OmpA-like peptidoglycan-associated protein